MLDSILENASTIIVSSLLILLLVSISLKLILDKKNGKGSCGGNCNNCHSGCNH